MSSVYPFHMAYTESLYISAWAVGFCVARSDWVGNAKASKCGTSNRYRFPRFFFIWPRLSTKTGLNPSGLGNLQGHKTDIAMSEVKTFMDAALPRFEDKVEHEITDLFFLFVQSDKELTKLYLDTVAASGNLQAVNSQISKLLAEHFQLISTGVIKDNPHSNLIQSYSERSK